MGTKGPTSFPSSRYSLECTRSALCVDTGLEMIDDSQFWIWYGNLTDSVSVSIEDWPISRLAKWGIDQESGSLRHDSGKFFSIDGIKVSTSDGTSHRNWDQPIISQPEIGILGFVCTFINGVLHFLVQGKIEPGNENQVQLSPTLQATKSNYTLVHGGRVPQYLHLFLNPSHSSVLCDQLQSEQGSRFYKKRNRNIVVYQQEILDIPKNFIWLTLGQLKRLMRYNNLVNMDTRTVISGLSFFEIGMSELEELSAWSQRHLQGFWSKFCPTGDQFGQEIHSMQEILHRITMLRAKYDLEVVQIPLVHCREWNVGYESISRQDGRYFSVIGVDVCIGSREITSWQQPMIKPAQTGICAFLWTLSEGIPHFLIQAKVECGNREVIELAPTVQCLTGNYALPDSEPVPFLDDVLNAPKVCVSHESIQSEEGGRFYFEGNRCLIVFIDLCNCTIPNERFFWVAYHQLRDLSKHSNYLNIQARSLLSLLTFFE